MADAVSKLYAEIGFKVNDDELKKAEKVIKGLATTLSQINNNAKEAAKEYGIFSKQRSKQALDDEKLATQQEKTQTQRTKRIIESEKFKHKQLMDYAKFAMQVEKYNNQEKEKEAQKQLHNTEKNLKTIKSIYNSAYSSISKTMRAAGRVFQRIVGQSLGDAMLNSLRTSVPIRDLMMQTGVGFSESQNISRGFANIGINAPQEEILSNLRDVQQKIVNISFGEKGGTFPYKLLGLAARNNDMVGMVRELGKAINDLRNPEALNLLQRVGLDEKWLSYFRLQERGGGLRNRLSAEGNEQLTEAEIALMQLRYGFSETAKIITSQLQPAIKESSHAILGAFDEVIDEFRTNPEIAKSFTELGKEFATFIKSIDWTAIPSLIHQAIDGIKLFAKVVNHAVKKIARLFNIDTSGDEAVEYAAKKARAEKGGITEALKIFNENKDWFNQREGESYSDWQKRIKTSNPEQEKVNEMRENFNLMSKYLKPTNQIPVSYTNANTINIEGVTPEKMAETAESVTKWATRMDWPDTEVFRTDNKGAFLSGNMA